MDANSFGSTLNRCCSTEFGWAGVTSGCGTEGACYCSAGRQIEAVWDGPKQRKTSHFEETDCPRKITSQVWKNELQDMAYSQGPQHAQPVSPTVWSADKKQENPNGQNRSARISQPMLTYAALKVDDD